LQAESINDLIHAQTELALRRSMQQVQGSLSRALQEIETEMVNLLGYVEASFEFLDEEQRDFDFDQAIKDRTQALLDHLSQIKRHFVAQQQIKEGIRIALVGSVNVGKSTLFNALVRKDRAIVADVAGTTRDSIETTLYRDGNFWLVIDTAGLRPTEDIIEQQGIGRSLAEAASADIVLLVLDATRPLTEMQQQEYAHLVALHRDKIMVVVNKIDQLAPKEELATPDFLNNLTTVRVSAKDKIGVEELEACVGRTIQKIFEQLNSPYLLNQRQFKLLTEIGQALEFIANSYSDGVHCELIAYQLKDLLEKISELTGKNISEQVLDKVFDEFCVGK
jgi:tRNA modification GTPase